MLPLLSIVEFAGWRYTKEIHFARPHREPINWHVFCEIFRWKLKTNWNWQPKKRKIEIEKAKEKTINILSANAECACMAPITAKANIYTENEHRPPSPPCAQIIIIFLFHSIPIKTKEKRNTNFEKRKKTSKYWNSMRAMTETKTMIHRMERNNNRNSREKKTKNYNKYYRWPGRTICVHNTNFTSLSLFLCFFTFSPLLVFYCRRCSMLGACVRFLVTKRWPRTTTRQRESPIGSKIIWSRFTANNKHNQMADRHYYFDFFFFFLPFFLGLCRRVSCLCRRLRRIQFYSFFCVGIFSNIILSLYSFAALTFTITFDELEITEGKKGDDGNDNNKQFI